MKKTKALEFLDRWGFPYELRSFEATEYTADEAARELGLSPSMLFKTLVAHGDRHGYVMALVPADGMLSVRKLAHATGDKKIDLIDVNDLQRLTGYIKGGVSPLGSKRAMPVYLDFTAFQHPQISVSAGLRGWQILIAPAHLQQATRATVAEIIDEV